MREVHIFEEADSPKLADFQRLAEFATPKTDCVMDGVGGICFNCPPEKSEELEAAAEAVGVRMQWGIVATGQLKIYRINPDGSFTLQSTLALGDTYQRMVLQGRYLYLCRTNGGSQNMVTIDVGQPRFPTVSSTKNVGVAGRGIFAQGRWVYVAGVGGVAIVDISVPVDPVVRGTAV